MRLNSQEHAAITSTIHKADPAAQVYLFGSRANDQLLGGDIDLLLVSQKINLMAKLRILAKLHHAIGQRKIDLIVTPNTEQPFTQIALQTAIRLN